MSFCDFIASNLQLADRRLEYERTKKSLLSTKFMIANAGPMLSTLFTVSELIFASLKAIIAKPFSKKKTQRQRV